MTTINFSPQTTVEISVCIHKITTWPGVIQELANP